MNDILYILALTVVSLFIPPMAIVLAAEVIHQYTKKR
jgi:hypothetical protein